MKTLLLLLLVALCGIAWRSPDIMDALGRARPQPQAVQLVVPPGGQAAGQKAMSLHEYAELARTDPDAYRKLLDSMRAPEERSEADKLMNFLARGKHE
ncbi:hypothetical protein [Noviherbaspirillum aridicola]|uniref:Uncharacterized protein n=1 Tax=Noviherbaspirillum aridicola TaxID=2849687 RepID=A0ABQ4Q683_9BURK|nr:hypothetical protein [Noviherbaspirillum aridicola]GIZ52315.1 hypothetical protein NCCP691_23290 [Noviherbaspirillum aridicola]